jgi:hypothetical protein
MATFSLKRIRIALQFTVLAQELEVWKRSNHWALYFTKGSGKIIEN